MSAIIRLATIEDAEPIRDIYAPYVRDTPISFEVVPPTVDEMRQRIENTLKRFPWLVCEQNGAIFGYVYASPHHPRIAYQWSVDVAVYINGQYHRSGIGRALYTSLFHLLVLQGIYTACAGVTLPNSGSVGLHESLGFKLVGVYHSIGFKSGAWHDVGWWELTLQPPSASEPAAPLTMDALATQVQWETAINAGLPLLRL